MESLALGVHDGKEDAHVGVAEVPQNFLNLHEVVVHHTKVWNLAVAEI